MIHAEESVWSTAQRTKMLKKLILMLGKMVELVVWSCVAESGWSSLHKGIGVCGLRGKGGKKGHEKVGLAKNEGWIVQGRCALASEELFIYASK